MSILSELLANQHQVCPEAWQRYPAYRTVGTFLQIFGDFVRAGEDTQFVQALIDPQVKLTGRVRGCVLKLLAYLFCHNLGVLDIRKPAKRERWNQGGQQGKRQDSFLDFVQPEDVKKAR